MRIIWHSAVPWLHTGYATCTEEIATRLHNNGHEVAIQCMNSLREGPILWHGEGADCELDRPMKIYPAKSPFGVKDVADHCNDFNADYYFTHFDSWMEPAKDVIPELNITHSSYVIVDHDPAPTAVVEQVKNTLETISMSKYAKSKLQERGVPSRHIPHGIDTDDYYPLIGDDRPDTIEIRDDSGDIRKVDPDDRFIIGMVAANHGARKNIPNHFEAFKTFLDRVDEDALLYIHTEQDAKNGYNLREVQKHIGIPDRNILWARGEDYGEVGNEFLNALYNVFDIFVNCSFGESWGLTVTEAQAAGTPAIVSNFSAMPEQLGVMDGSIDWIYDDVGIAPHGIVCEPSTPLWKQKVNSKQYIVKPKTIYKAMRYYYEDEVLREDHGAKASGYVVEHYDWEDAVMPKFYDHFELMEDLVT